MRPVARLRGGYPEKFGVPRQSGLVPSARGTVVFEPDYRRDEAVRGLEGFSHVWLVWVFDQVPEDETRLSVRPPRLGGNDKLGVFATRSPFRPNRIGLSVVKLERVVTGGEDEKKERAYEHYRVSEAMGAVCLWTFYHHWKLWRSQKACRPALSPLKTLRSMGWAMRPKYWGLRHELVL